MRVNNISLENIRFERNDQVLLRNITCTLNAGEALQIRGANGSGKSTLLRILAGYLEAQEGNVLWCNQSILDCPEAYTQNLHYLGHQHGTKKGLTVLENLRLNAALKGKKISQNQLYKTLEHVSLHLHHDTLAQHLSAGQLRRLALAKLLLQDCPLWLLDEPTAALDTVGQHLLFELLNTHLAQGGIAIIATHHDLPLSSAVKTLHLGGNHA